MLRHLEYELLGSAIPGGDVCEKGDVSFLLGFHVCVVLALLVQRAVLAVVEAARSLVNELRYSVTALILTPRPVGVVEPGLDPAKTCTVGLYSGAVVFCGTLAAEMKVGATCCAKVELSPISGVKILKTFPAYDRGSGVLVLETIAVVNILS